MIQPNSSPQPDGPIQPGSSLLPPQKEVSGEYYLKLGKNLYKSYLAHSCQQDLDAAIRHFQKAVEVEPGLAEAYVQLASALWEQGTINLELAQFYCETALKLDASQASANLFLGYFLQRAGFLDDATRQYSTAIRKNFWQSARPRIALGNALLKQSLQAGGQYQRILLALQGIAYFGTGCCLLPLDRTACLILKEALLADTQVYSLDLLAKGFKKMGFSSAARQIYFLGSRIMPHEPLFYHLLGDEYLYELNDPARAIHCYKQVQVLSPGDINLLKKLGKAYAKLNESSNAVTTLNMAIDLDPRDFDVLYHLGQLHAEMKSYFKALYYFKEAERQQPRYPYLHSNMAYILFKMEDTEGAFEEYKLALEYGTDPEWLSCVAQTLGSFCYQVHGDTDQALDYLQQSLQFNPQNYETLAMLADLYFEAGHFEMALSAYKSILKIDGKNANCYSNVGYILWQMDRNQEAIDAYLTALHYDRNNCVAYNNLGVIYLDDQQDPERALPLFKAALSLKPDYTLACFNIARSMEALGQIMEAAEHYSEASKLNQLNPELEDREIRDRLDHLFD